MLFIHSSHATVKLNDGTVVNAYEAVHDENWIKNEFIPCVQKRGAAILGN
jgi:hypothetical protein